MTKSRAIRAAAVVAALMVPFAAVGLTASTASATPAPTKACNSSAKDDFNGDGLSDIAVTQANATSKDENELGKTAVRVLYGSKTGLTKTTDLYLDGSGLGSAFTPATEDVFGVSVAIGDFNGDGCADLAINAMGLPTSKSLVTHGYVIVYYGSPTGLQTTSGTVIPEASIVPSTQKTTSLLESSAAGDFNGDHFDDLAVGVPDSTLSGDTDTGGVAILDGSSTGLVSTGRQWFTQATAGVIGTAESFDEFGQVIAAGDFNGDGKADIAVGAPEQTVGSAGEAGTVTALYGSASGITATGSQQWNQSSTGVPGTAGDGDGFGTAVAAGDVNKDGKVDLVVGAPYDTVGGLSAGTVTLLKGSSTGLTGTGSQLFDQDTTGVPGTSEDGDAFGSSVSIGDFNGDGFGDVAVGVPDEAIGSVNSAGEVNVIYGNATGLTGTGSQGWDQNSTGISGTSEANDQMGFTVLAVNLTSLTHSDLIVGVPYEDSDSKTDNGLLNVIHGSTAKAGLTATGNQGFDAIGLVNGPVNYGLWGVEMS